MFTYIYLCLIEFTYCYQNLLVFTEVSLDKGIPALLSAYFAYNICYPKGTVNVMSILEIIFLKSSLDKAASSVKQFRANNEAHWLFIKFLFINNIPVTISVTCTLGRSSSVLDTPSGSVRMGTTISHCIWCVCHTSVFIVWEICWWKALLKSIILT